MKLIKCLLIASVFFAVLSLRAFAADMPESELLDTAPLKNALGDEAADALQDVEINEELDFASHFTRILEGSAGKIPGFIRSGLRSAGLMLMITLLSAVLSSFDGGSAALRYSEMAAVLGIGAVTIADVSGFIGLGQNLLTQLSDFSRALLPALSGAAAFSGAFTGAAGKYAASALFMEILITLSNRLILPLLYAYTATLLAAAVTGNEALAALGKLIRWLCNGLLVLTVTLFAAFLSVAGIASGTSDAFAARFVKSAVSTALPVVGGIIADAAGTIVSGAGMLKNAVGIFGLLAVAAICLTPVLRLGLQYLIYKFSAGLSGVLSGKRLSDLMSGIGSAFGMLLGMTGACALMLYVSVLSSMRVVSG